MKYLLVIILFWGCVTPKKVDDFLQKNPDYIAKQCAEKFPIIQDTFVNIWVDSVLVHDTFLNVINSVEYLPENCPKPKVVTKVVTITKKSTAELAALQKIKSADSLAYIRKEKNMLDLLSKQADETRKYEAQINKLKGRNQWALWLAILCAIVVLLRSLMRK